METSVVVILDVLDAVIVVVSVSVVVAVAVTSDTSGVVGVACRCVVVGIDSVSVDDKSTKKTNIYNKPTYTHLEFNSCKQRFPVWKLTSVVKNKFKRFGLLLFVTLPNLNG